MWNSFSTDARTGITAEVISYPPPAGRIGPARKPPGSARGFACSRDDRASARSRFWPRGRRRRSGQPRAYGRDFRAVRTLIWSLTTEDGSSPSVSSQLGGERRGARSKRSRAPARRGDRGRQRDNYRTGRSGSHHPRQHVPRALRRVHGFIGRRRLAGGVVHHLGRAPLSRAGNCPEPRQPVPFLHRLGGWRSRLTLGGRGGRGRRARLRLRPNARTACWSTGQLAIRPEAYRRRLPFGSGNCAAMPFTSCGPRLPARSPAAAPRRIRR